MITPLEASDRQYFAAQRKIRRHKIDQWQMEHHPKRFRRRAVQLAAQAERRQQKQDARDNARKEAADALLAH